MNLDKVAKAVVAALAAAYGIYEFATIAESAGGMGVTSAEWVRVAVFGLIAGVTTWAVPNKVPPQEPAQPVVPVVVPVESTQVPHSVIAEALNSNPRYDAQP